MYPPSSTSFSSSSHHQMAHSGLVPHGSAPGSFLATYSIVRSVHTTLIGPQGYLSSEISDLPTPGQITAMDVSDGGLTNNTEKLTQRSHGCDFATANSPNAGVGLPLVRRKSSASRFLNQLAAVIATDNDFSVRSGIGSCNSKSTGDGCCETSRLNSHMSSTQVSFCDVSEENGISTNNCNGNSANSFASSSFVMGSWDDDTNAITFSVSPNKRDKNTSNDIFSGFNTLEFQFPQHSVPWKTRAKRGCATHPRSIAERDRRIRISGKLKKLQELVPNLDKQTSYADMLDFAVQHIKGLQNQVKKLNKELEKCTCGCKQST